MRRQLACAVGGVVLLAGVVAIVGCGGGGGGVTASVPLGTMKQYSGAEQWTYNLTGTFVSGAGVPTAVTPATATLDLAAGTTLVNGVAARTMTLSAPLTYPGYSATEVFVVALTQAADGNLTLQGVDPNAALIGALATPFALPGPSVFGSNWSGTSSVDIFNDLVVATQYRGVEVVSAAGETYECYKYEGTKSLDGFQTTLNFWFNPQTGAFVKLVYSYPDHGGTLTVNYLLAGHTSS